MKATNSTWNMSALTLERRICKRAVASCLAALLVVMTGAAAWAQNLLWAKRAGSNSNELGESVAVDVSGNVYVTGFFQGITTFGPGEPNQTILTPVGRDVFIAKYNSFGLLQWVKQVSSSGALGNGIALDGSGNIYITGHFPNSATFAPGEINETTLVPVGGNDLFVAKYDNNGAFLWAKTAGGLFSDEAYGIAVDGGGNSYITGAFSGLEATFGQGEPNETTLKSGTNTFDVFVAKYNTNGQFQWVRRTTGLNTDKGYSIAVSVAGNSYITGEFTNSITFAPGEAGQTTLTAATTANTDFFIAKYNSVGQFQWARRAGGTNQSTLESHIALDVLGNAYLTGTLRGTATFGPGEANQTDLASAGSDDIVVAKYDTNGFLQWAKRAGGTGIDTGSGIATDFFGNSYLTGYFRTDPATFGLGEINQTTLDSAGAEDIFVAKYDTNGLLQWARRAGGPSDDRGLAIAADFSGNAYIAGRFAQTATFGLGETNQTSLKSASGPDIFVAKYANGTIVVDCPSNSLQTAVNLAGPGQTILVSGTCSENILIRNEKQRITIDGAGAGVGTRAVVSGNGSSPSFNVRGKGILIQNFTITGGSVGVYVNRGSNAVLHNNVIENTNGIGVLIDELAFGVLTSNTIQNNPEDGMWVAEGSTARIGFNSDADSTASSNTIQNNAGIGIVVGRGASARIVGNTIQGNTEDGIWVTRDGHADISGNVISGNGGNGILVSENAFVQLGEDSGTGIFEAPNTTTGANTGFGIRCINGGIADGRQGTLSGSGGANSFDSSCITDLAP